MKDIIVKRICGKCRQEFEYLLTDEDAKCPRCNWTIRPHKKCNTCGQEIKK